jgi:hypothetical protein
MATDGTQCIGCGFKQTPRPNGWCAHFDIEPTFHCTLFLAAATTGMVGMAGVAPAPAASPLPSFDVPSILGNIADMGISALTSVQRAGSEAVEQVASVMPDPNALLTAASEATSAGMDAVLAAGSGLADAAGSVAGAIGDIAGSIDL